MSPAGVACWQRRVDVSANEKATITTTVVMPAEMLYSPLAPGIKRTRFRSWLHVRMMPRLARDNPSQTKFPLFCNVHGSQRHICCIRSLAGFWYAGWRFCRSASSRRVVKMMRGLGTYTRAAARTAFAEQCSCRLYTRGTAAEAEVLPVTLRLNYCGDTEEEMPSFA